MKNILTAAGRAWCGISNKLRRIPSWAALCALAAVMILTGALRGEAGTQLAKAIRICLECIGIG